MYFESLIAEENYKDPVHFCNQKCVCRKKWAVAFLGVQLLIPEHFVTYDHLIAYYSSNQAHYSSKTCLFSLHL